MKLTRRMHFSHIACSDLLERMLNMASSMWFMKVNFKQMKYFFLNTSTIIFLIFNYLFPLQTNAQICKDSLKQHVITLSCDKFEGRSIDSEGIRYAEQYILNEINALNLFPLNGSYRQEFSITKNKTHTPKNPALTFNRNKLIYEDSFYTIRTDCTETCKYPIYTAEKFKTHNIKKDCAILFKDIHEINSTKSDFVKLMLVSTHNKDEYKQIIKANTSGIFSQQETSKFIIKNKDLIYYLSPSCTKKISSSLKSKTLNHITSSCTTAHSITNTANIYGMIRGASDDSTIVISAHYDHIGIRNGKINHGANDNASGVSAVLEIAEALKIKEEKPMYNILFVFFSAEESGLLGSDYFIKNCPFDIKNIMANINLDMIGNRDSFHKDEPNFIYAYGPQNSQHLINKIDSINTIKSYLKLDFYEHDIEEGKRFLKMSDQASFIKMNIPVLFIFNGLSPNYHKPLDTYEKLDYNKMKNVCDLTIDLITEITY